MSEVMRFNMFPAGQPNPAANGLYVRHEDYARLEQECERLCSALEFACKSLAQVTSSDGSGHADIALAVLRMAGVDPAERERMVEEWKSASQWRLDAALSHKP